MVGQGGGDFMSLGTAPAAQTPGTVTNSTRKSYQFSLNRAVMLLLTVVWPTSVTAVVTLSGP